MTTIEHGLACVVQALGTVRARFALIGGLAVSVRTEPRFTRDIDVTLSVAGDAEAERVVDGLVQHGLSIHSHLEQTATGRLATVRLAWSAGGEPILDLLFASSGIEAEVVAAADQIEVFRGVTVPVAALAHLLALKVLSRDDRSRPQDRVDLLALIRVATDDDVRAARDALELIRRRGYHRGRDLAAGLDAVRREAAGDDVT